MAEMKAILQTKDGATRTIHVNDPPPGELVFVLVPDATTLRWGGPPSPSDGPVCGKRRYTLRAVTEGVSGGSVAMYLERWP